MTAPDAAAFPSVDQTLDLLQSLLSPEDRLTLFHLLGNDGHWQRRFEPVEAKRDTVEAIVVTCCGEALKVEAINLEEAPK